MGKVEQVKLSASVEFRLEFLDEVEILREILSFLHPGNPFLKITGDVTVIVKFIAITSIRAMYALHNRHVRLFRKYHCSHLG